MLCLLDKVVSNLTFSKTTKQNERKATHSVFANEAKTNEKNRFFRKPSKAQNLEWKINRRFSNPEKHRPKI